MNQPEHLLQAHNKLGETPIWSPEENALYWVDWGGQPSCRFEPQTGEFTTFPVKPPVTALARRAAGGWIAIAQNGLPMEPTVELPHEIAGTSGQTIQVAGAAQEQFAPGDGR